MNVLSRKLRELECNVLEFPPKDEDIVLHVGETKMSFYILTSNPQIIRGNMENWKISRYGHASKGRGNTRINNEIRSSLSRNRITVSLQYSSYSNHE
jgi:hypothetical protein